MGLLFFPSPALEIICLASRSARENSEETKGTGTQSTHMELWAPVIRSGTSVAFWGCLHVQVIRPKPAVPFSLFTFYAPIASTTTVCPNNILSDGSPKSRFFVVVYSLEGGSGRELVGSKGEKGLFWVYPMRHLNVSKWAFATSEERFALTFIFRSYKLQMLVLVLKMQPSVVNLPAQETLLLYRQLLYSGPNFPVSDPDVIQGN